MARSADVADVPALLEAMVGWLDPACDVGESALLRRWQAEGGVASALAARVTRWTAAPLDALRRHWPEYLMEAAGPRPVHDLGRAVRHAPVPSGLAGLPGAAGSLAAAFAVICT
jgi:hypothetical protein